MSKANEGYIVQAKELNAQQQERVMSRMDNKLQKRVEKQKITALEAVAIQLEIEDELLEEWREKVAEIRENERKAEEKLAKKK